MKKMLVCLAALSVATCSYGDLLITMVEDGDLSSMPRFVEIYNTGLSSVDLGTSNIKLGQSANGAAPSYSTLAGTIGAGAYAYLMENDNQATFESAYGVGKTYITASQASSNGDDAYLLAAGLMGSEVPFDVFGVSLVDGTGYNWEFTDGAMMRTSANNTQHSTFDYAGPALGNSGVNLTGWTWVDLDGVLVGDYATTAPIGTWAAVPEPATLGFMGIGLTALFLARRRITK